MGKELLRIITKLSQPRKRQLKAKHSVPEKHFSELLNKANIFYHREKCCYDAKGHWYYIDFYLPIYKIGIEIDGIEHRYGERKEKDIEKDKFLEKSRNIKIVRISNKQCLSMDKINIVELYHKAYPKIPKTIEHFNARVAYRHKTKEQFEKTVSSRINFDYNVPIYIYDKEKDHVFKFNNLYMLRRCTGVKFRYLWAGIKRQDDVLASALFLYAFNEYDLSKRIDEYKLLKNKS